MGVQTHISLEQAQKLFSGFSLHNLQATVHGVMDTTYLLDNYVLKHYEREIDTKIQADKERLSHFVANGLNTPLHLDSASKWHLYSRLDGNVPKSIHYFHIQALARFVAKLHTLTYKREANNSFLEQYNLHDILDFTKKNHYIYYKKLQSLQNIEQREDGFIHGDIFKDNTLFEGEKLGIFDFIDGGMGAFSFDIAVILVSFNPKKRSSYIKLFLNTYNQKAPKKISLYDLEKQIKNASKLYGLLRIQKYKNPKKAKLLANLW